MKSIFNILVFQILSLAVSMINSHIIHEEKSGNDEYTGIVDLENIPRANKVKKSVAIKNKHDLWDEGIIPYEIDDIFTGSQLTIFKRAMRMWEQSTCIQFIERDPKIHPDYVFITKSDCGCCFEGKMPRNNGRSELSLDDGCDKLLIVLHELGHALGFYHEHQHPDRDQYVHINWQNIRRGFRQEFSKFSPDQVDTLQQPYNYHSIMHYPPNAYAYFDFLDTIVPKQLENGRVPKIGSYVRLSIGDIEATNRLYQCPKCGRTLFENNGTIELPKDLANSSSTDIDYCEWRISASHGEKVAFKIVTLNTPKSLECTTDFIEVRNGLTSYSPLLGKYCGEEKNILTISDNVLVKYLKSSKDNNLDSGFIAKYYKICGGEKSLCSNDSIILESPNYPNYYESNKDCSWELKVPENHSTTIKFNFFSLEMSTDCANDYVEIGVSDDSHSNIETFCGERSPWEITLNYTKIYFNFVSDNLNEEAGFSATITTVPLSY